MCAGCSKTRLAAFYRTVDAFLHALGHGFFEFVGGGLFVMQPVHALLPLVQFGVAENSVLNDLGALVFVLESRRLPFGARGADELLQGRIPDGRLRVDVEDRGRRALEAEREAPGFSESRPKD